MTVTAQIPLATLLTLSVFPETLAVQMPLFDVAEKVAVTLEFEFKVMDSLPPG
jgi:hypothetical protein